MKLFLSPASTSAALVFLTRTRARRDSGSLAPPVGIKPVVENRQPPKRAVQPSVVAPLNPADGQRIVKTSRSIRISASKSRSAPSPLIRGRRFSLGSRNTLVLYRYPRTVTAKDRASASSRTPAAPRPAQMATELPAIFQAAAARAMHVQCGSAPAHVPSEIAPIRGVWSRGRRGRRSRFVNCCSAFIRGRLINVSFRHPASRATVASRLPG